MEDPNLTPCNSRHLDILQTPKIHTGEEIAPSTNDIEKLVVYTRNKSRSLSFTPQKINPKSIKDLTIELETLKPLEDVGSVHTGIAKIFHSRTAAVQEIRPTHNKRDLVK